MLNGLDLFSGYGGAQDALRGLVRPVAYCEIERGAQRILLRRMRKGQINVAPIWDDVSTLRRGDIAEPIDIITGGFPCQDISIAGTGDGLGGKRSGLFFEIIRLVREFRPQFIFLENVPAITFRGLDRVLMELDSVGYDARWTIVSAAEVGACHLRERVWILGHSNCEHRDLSNAESSDSERFSALCSRHRHPNTYSISIRTQQVKQQGCIYPTLAKWDGIGWNPSWSSEGFSQPRVDRTGHGIVDRGHRARALGNGWVPQTAKEAFKRLSGIKFVID